MIPLRHTIERSIPPTVTRVLLAMNAVIFAAQLLLGDATERIISTFGFIPGRLTNPAAYGFTPWEVAITLVTSLFLHGGVVHLAGNLIYLYVFGGGVEDALGHSRYLALYLACGALGSLSHTLLFPGSAVPSIGASGCIAGILGAFFVLRPRARIVTLFPLVVYWAMAEVPATLFLPVWFLMQFFNGFLSLQAARGTQDEVAGIAWWAHVGGFVAGALIAWVLKKKPIAADETQMSS